MNLAKLEDLISKDVELMVGGHFFTGRIVEADAASDTIVFEENDGEVNSKCTIDASAVQLVKVQ